MDYFGFRARSRQGGRWLQLTLLLCVLLGLALDALYIARTITFPYGMDYGEGPIIDQAGRIARGEVLYRADLDDAPYIVANYPPLYPLAIAGAGAILHLPYLQTGRCISALAGLLSGVLVGLIARQLLGSRLALWAGVLFLINPLVLYWLALARVDMLGLFFSLAGLWLLYRIPRTWWRLFVAASCLLAAVYTRQTFIIAAPLAAGVWLGQIDRRRCLILFSFLVAVGLFLFVGLNMLTAGGFALNIIWANVNAFFPAKAASGLFGIVRLCAGVMLLFVVALFARVRQPACSIDVERRRRAMLWSLLAYGLGALVPALMSGKIGSNVNYFLELAVALAIAAAYAIVVLSRSDRSYNMAGRYLLLAQAACWLFVGWSFYRDQVVGSWRQLPVYEQVYREVQEVRLRGPVLLEAQLELVVMAGQSIYYQPFECTQLYLAGLWNANSLVQSIRAHQFPLIFRSTIQGPGGSDQGMWPAPVAAAIEAEYQPRDRIGGWTAYTPRGPITQAPIALSP